MGTPLHRDFDWRGREPVLLEDVVGVIFDGAPLRAGAGVIAEQQRLLLSLLCREFGITWDDAWGPSDLRRLGVPMLLADMGGGYRQLRAPDDLVAEYVFRAGEKAVLDPYLAEIRASTEALRAEWRRLGAALLALRWPAAAGRSTTVARLGSLGLPDLDDPDDPF